MAKAKKPLNKTGVIANIAGATDMPEKQVAAVLEALTAEIRKSLGNKGAGVITIPGLVRIEKKTVPCCPTWPASIKLTVVPELLPGPNYDCARGRHTYFRSPAANDRGNPVCGLCGKDTIDWDRLHERDITDVEYTIAQLKTDRWQNEWWSKDIDAKAVQHAHRKGPTGLKDAVRRRVFQSVGRVYHLKNGKVQPFNDGRQTTDKVGKMTIIHYGQHATATCCRKCIEVWHGISRGGLTEKETDYLVELLMRLCFFQAPGTGNGATTA